MCVGVVLLVLVMMLLVMLVLVLVDAPAHAAVVDGEDDVWGMAGGRRRGGGCRLHCPKGR